MRSELKSSKVIIMNSYNNNNKIRKGKWGQERRVTLS